MKPILGTENPQIKYVRYETPSAFRKAGAFLPRKIMGIYNYRLSPYMGCAKRCQYCFEYHNEFINSNEVKIKTNTVSILKKGIENMGESNPILLDGYDCEVAEQKERLIRDSLEVMIKHGQSVLIQTKSGLVLRDLDLLEELNALADFVSVSFSLTSLDKEHARIFEPYTCTPENRLKAMRAVSDAGISTGIILMPVIPHISDTDECLDTLFSKASECGCQYIVPEPLRIRSTGNQREMCFNTLRQHFPHLIGRYKKLYPASPSGPKFGSGPQDPNYLQSLSKRIHSFAKNYGIPVEFPRFTKREPGRARAMAGRQRTLDSFMEP